MRHNVIRNECLSYSAGNQIIIRYYKELEITMKSPLGQGAPARFGMWRFRQKGYRKIEIEYDCHWYKLVRENTQEVALTKLEYLY